MDVVIMIKTTSWSNKNNLSSINQDIVYKKSAVILSTYETIEMKCKVELAIFI
jgi:hypothetical protein